MNRKELARELAKKTKLSAKQAENLVIAFGATVTDVLEKQKKLVYSNFGTFYTVHYPSKTIYHPKHGKKKTMIMLPTNVAKWLPSGNIKKMVNHGLDVDEPTRHKSQKETRDKRQEITASSGTPPKAVANESKVPESKTQINAKDHIPNKSDLSKPKAESSQPEASTNLGQIEDLEEYQRAKQELEDPTSTTDKKIVESKKKSQPSAGSSQNNSIYEEILSDGSSEVSTVDGSIKAHKRSEEDDHKMDDIVAKNKELEDKDESSEKSKDGPFSKIKSKLGIGKNKERDKDKEKLKKIETTKRESDKDEGKKDAVSLAGSGIFGAESFRNRPKEEKKKTAGEKKIKKIKDELDEGSKSQEIDSLSKKPETAKANLSLAREPINIVYKDLTKEEIDKDLLVKIPEKLARKYKAVPVSQKDGVVSVAMVDPQDIETKEILKKNLGSNLQIILATEADINHVLNQYQGLESEVTEVIESAEESDKEEKEAEKKKKEKDKKVSPDEITDDAPAAKIADSLLKRAIRDKASDIHIEPTENEVEVRFRVDGILRKKVSLPKDIQSAVISRLKILSNLKIDEQRVPQDGRFNMDVDRRRVDFRVSTMPIAAGEKMVIRILDKESGILTIEQLGIQGNAKNALEEDLKRSHGMILVTGPTGSGKSTTLYAMISKLYNVGVNIITLEDPIEYQIKGINQSQVNSSIGYTFASGLRSILRQDPDIIMLGEIRDKETAEMAVHAALTGHVVLSTLHTNTAAGATPRMIDMGVEPFLLTSSVNTVVAQRLVRKVCSECKEEEKLSAEEMKIIKEEVEKMPEAEKAIVKKKGLKFYKGKGCKTCDKSGTKGRIGIYEVLNVTDEIKELVQKRSPESAINTKAIEQGMVTIIQDGIIKAIGGFIPMSEVWRVTKE